MMKRLLTVICLVLCGCRTPDVSQYANLKPGLDLEHYFIGHTDAYGMFQKRDGTLVKRFHVVITGTKKDDSLILDEQFSYDDGTHQQRIWTLTRDAQHRWHGKAADVTDEAIGEIAGNTLHWQYGLLLPVDGSDWNMHFDDWMYLVDDNVMINRASMSKWGIELGQVTLFFVKKS